MTPEVGELRGLPRLEDGMNFFVDANSGVPIFRQLMDQVKLHIASGALKPGDELPSIRSLSVPLGVNPMTISKAYNLLVRENVLSRRPGLPLVVAPLDEGALTLSRTAQLREGLKPAARLTRQLKMSPDEAIGVFKDLLENQTGSEDES
jgi:GntR family transcriptional regulator